MVAFHNFIDHSIVQQGDHFPDPPELDVLVDCSTINDDGFNKETTIGWIVESPAILEAYAPGFQRVLKERLESGTCNFKKLYTYDPSYKGLPNVFMLDYCPASTWIEEENRKIHPKSKLVSFISSSKTITPMQKDRTELLGRFIHDNNVDVYGRNVNPIEKKSDALRDYCFSFAVENCCSSGYWTEKILDCFITGTVPIYIGDPDIHKVFDLRGVIKFNPNEDFNLSFERYYDMMPYVQKNYETAIHIKNEFRHQIPILIKDYLHD